MGFLDLFVFIEDNFGGKASLKRLNELHVRYEEQQI